ncbi:protein CASC3 isoform X2 [Rhincodon typus]|uniref:protein CASC3 isoform X2 n=1 Tax=Rhincodon typus TaxID=259920 RepID=UPI0009A28ADE|nr:protein CASC3 isoform X2 [Rhincodon typus]
MADRRRRRASQDTDEEDEDVPRSEVEAGPSVTCILDLSGVQAREAESECESEDGIEGDAVVLSDYESTEENGSQKSGDEEEAEYSEEDVPREEIKSNNEGDKDESSKEGKAEDKREVTGERQSGDGQESTEPIENKIGKKNRRQLDDDEDRKNPAYIPRKGLFFEHDLRGHTEPEEVRPKVRQRKLWKDEGRWVHDKFQEDEQAPKSRDELISLYGYDIRSDRNPDEIRPRRIRKPRFRSPQNREPDWMDEPPPPRTYMRKLGSSVPSTRTFNRRVGGPERRSPAKSYSKNAAYNEDRINMKPAEINNSRSYHSSGELSISENKTDVKNAEQSNMRESVIVTDSVQSVKNNGVVKEDTIVQNQSLPTEDVPQVQEKMIEKKSYSRIRRTRNKVTEVGKPLVVEDSSVPALASPAQQVPVQSVPPPVPKAGSWETPPLDPAMTGLEREMTQMNLSGKNWPVSTQPQYVQPRELRGIPNSLHIGTAPTQYNRVEEMGSQGRRAKRYSSQRQRPLPEAPPPPPPPPPPPQQPAPAPAPALGPGPAAGPAPMHIGLMEGHYYDPLQFQGPIYTHNESPAPLPPQGMIVQPDMHLPHPGFNHHQSPGHLTNPGLYAPQVQMPAGQPPPPQVLPPPFFTPGMMNYGNPSYPYTTGGLPPHIYPTTQAQSQVFGGVTYYNTVQQQALPKPSPPRRQSQPVTVKPPPPEVLDTSVIWFPCSLGTTPSEAAKYHDARSEKLKERNEA